MCEATGQSVGVRRVSFFLSHEQKSAHVCACHPWQEGHAATSECAGAMLFFSKRKTCYTSRFPVLDDCYIHTPPWCSTPIYEVPSRPDRPEKFQEHSIGCFEPFQKESEERLTCRLIHLPGSEHQHVDQSPQSSPHHWSPPRIPRPPRSTDLHLFPLPQ